jgi:ribosomal protein L11 methyltransferase
MDYLELEVKLDPKDPWSEILIAELSEAGYESFMETDFGILAYASMADIDQINPLKGTFLDKKSSFNGNCSWSIQIIPKQNWNESWEKAFHPVQVDDYLTILAPFHEKGNAKGLIVEIMPKMSFGTGHHQTTYLMARALFSFNPFPKTVLDMGTGTGILAIVAEKLGAEKIIAVDIEDWSVANTIENCERNNCHSIQAVCGDIDAINAEMQFDLILANINKNILKAHMSSYAKLLAPNGYLLLSGFFNTDIEEMTLLLTANNLSIIDDSEKENWVYLKCTKKLH